MKVVPLYVLLALISSVPPPALVMSREPPLSPMAPVRRSSGAVLGVTVIVGLPFRRTPEATVAGPEAEDVAWMLPASASVPGPLIVPLVIFRLPAERALPIAI